MTLAFRCEVSQLALTEIDPLYCNCHFFMSFSIDGFRFCFCFFVIVSCLGFIFLFFLFHVRLEKLDIHVTRQWAFKSTMIHLERSHSCAICPAVYMFPVFVFGNLEPVIVKSNFCGFKLRFTQLTVSF